MKTIALLLMLSISTPTYAGIARFTAKHVVKPSAKLAAKTAFKALRLGWKIAF